MQASNAITGEQASNAITEYDWMKSAFTLFLLSVILVSLMASPPLLWPLHLVEIVSWIIFIAIGVLSVAVGGLAVCFWKKYCKHKP